MTYLPSPACMAGFNPTPIDQPPRSPMKEELHLMKSGDIDALQRYRATFWIQAGYDFFKPALKLLHVERLLRKSDQSQEALIQNFIKLGKRRETLEADEEVQRLQYKLETKQRHFWMLERKWYGMKALLRDGPLLRWMQTWRSNPDWYMHPVLVQDCAEQGGCFGRDCGCCAHRHRFISTTGCALSAGHCSVYFSCCDKARGFELTQDQVLELDKMFDFTGSRTEYSDRILLASFLGLTMDVLEKPRQDNLVDMKTGAMVYSEPAESE